MQMTPQKSQLLQQLHNCFFALFACRRATGLQNSSNMKRDTTSQGDDDGGGDGGDDNGCDDDGGDDDGGDDDGGGVILQ